MANIRMTNTTEKENVFQTLDNIDPKHENGEYKISEASSLIQINDNANKVPSAETLNDNTAKGSAW